MSPEASAQAVSSDPETRWALLLALVWGLLVIAIVVALRPLTPVDETRYATVAWEMRQSGDWLLLRLNGQPYGHKPPLLFWLLNAGWALFGVSAWWPQLLTGGFALGALVLVQRLAARLAPGQDFVVAATVLISGSGLYWLVFTGALMFDSMLAFFVLLAVHGVARAAAGGGMRAWAGTGLALGLAILTKGPVALLHVLPLVLLAPWWMAQRSGSSPVEARPAGTWRSWFQGAGLALAVAAAVALAWAVPAAIAGGAAFSREIFWSQSVDRMASTVHHLQPFWFYAALLPVLMLPWLLLPSFWGGLTGAWRHRSALPGLRFACAWVVPVLLAFSLFRGKQLQYLLPEVPALAFIVATALSAGAGRLRQADGWVVAGLYLSLAVGLGVASQHPRMAHLVQPAEWPLLAVTAAALLLAALLSVLAPRLAGVRALAVIGSASVLVVLGLYLGLGVAVRDGYDLVPIARTIAAEQQAGHPVAHLGKYHGQFQFLGRLQQPLPVLADRAGALDFAASQPDGRVLVTTRRPPQHRAGAAALALHRYRGGWISLWRAADLAGLDLETATVRADDRGD